MIFYAHLLTFGANIFVKLCYAKSLEAFAVLCLVIFVFPWVKGVKIAMVISAYKQDVLLCWDTATQPLCHSNAAD